MITDGHNTFQLNKEPADVNNPEGTPTGLELAAFRKELIAMQSEYRSPDITDPHGDGFEVSKVLAR